MSLSLIIAQTKVTRHDTLDFQLVESENIVSIGGDPYIVGVCIIVLQKTWEVVFMAGAFQVNYLGSSVYKTNGEIAGAIENFSLKRRQGWTSRPAMRVYVRGAEVL